MTMRIKLSSKMACKCGLYTAVFGGVGMMM